MQVETAAREEASTSLRQRCNNQCWKQRRSYRRVCSSRGHIDSDGTSLLVRECLFDGGHGQRKLGAQCATQLLLTVQDIGTYKFLLQVLYFVYLLVHFLFAHTFLALINSFCILCDFVHALRLSNSMRLLGFFGLLYERSWFCKRL